ncbi:MAG TPA: hypothetical protein VNG70_01755 [Candidatus Limnocylindria bacterium]|nr:hypothetical protein [Candidatus Limnocylindria bacterium]
MFEIAPDHAIGFFAGLLALPIALIALRLIPARRSVPGTAQAAAVLMALSGAIHLGLVTTHLEEPVTAALFVMNGVAYLGLSVLLTWRWWRLASAALLTATVLGYLVYIALRFDTPDQVALSTKLIELAALGLVLVPVRGESRPRDRAWYWATLAAGVPLLTVLMGSTVWLVDLANPDAQHVHAGAVLQATNEVATPEQTVAAAQLYAETKAAILPYQDWHKAWAAGYRPGGPSNMPSQHWMNEAYEKAGYVMDPQRPQGLVYANTRRGPLLLGAMFQMQHLDQFGPDPGGPLTAWHQHENICFTPFGFEFSLMTPFAICPLGAIDISASPMLHVWIVDNPGGPFAVDIDPAALAAVRARA